MVASSLSRMGRPRKSEPSDQLRIPKSVVKRIRRVATHQEKDPGDYVAEKLAAQLDKDEKAMMLDIEREQQKIKKG